MRSGSSPNFCPPVEEGVTFSFEDEKGDITELEFLGLLLYEGARYGFFFPIEKGAPALSSGEVVVLQVVDVDEEGQPSEFELVADENTALAVYAEFQKATGDLYRFE